MYVTHDGQLSVLLEQNITAGLCSLLVHWTWNGLGKYFPSSKGFGLRWVFFPHDGI